MKQEEVFQQIVDLLNRALRLIDQNEEIYESETIDIEDLYHKLNEISNVISNEIN
jgi:hypothetical protein